MPKTKATLQQHALSSLLWTSLAIGLLAQWLFIGRPLGISWFIFTLVLLLALAWHGRRAGLPINRRNLLLWTALLFFAAMVFLRANPFLTFLNIIATLVLLAYVAYYFAAGSLSQLSLSGIFYLPLRVTGLSLLNLEPVIGAGLKPLANDQQRSRELAPVLRGGALALPIMILFTALLASADLVFSAYLRRVIGLDFAAISPYMGRGLFIGLVTLFAAGGIGTAVLRGLRQPQDDESWVEQMTRHLPLRLSLGPVESGTILALVSGLFLCFVLLQVTYLFGGEANISREGFTYAEYARRGFLELVLVASLSLALILLLNWLTRRESKRQIKWFNGMSSLLISLVLLILVTAFWRMHLYEQAYGYTELRLIVLVFQFWLAILLLWFVATLWRAPERFALGFLIAAFGFLATLNLVNPDAFIVRHNLQRYRVTGKLDMAYLTGLSPDAVPALVAAWPDIKEDDQLVSPHYCYEEACQMTMREMLAENLSGRYEMMHERPNWLSARSFHLSRYRASQALSYLCEPQRTSDPKIGCGTS